MRKAWIAGCVAAACIALLLGDYIVASIPAKGKPDDKRITAARLARKSRDGIVAWVLIASAGLFLVYAPKSAAKRSEPKRRESEPRELGCGRQGAVTPEPTDLTFVDDLVDREGRSKEKAIALLQAIQTHYRYLPDEALRRLCQLTEITPAQIAGTSSFYGQFRNRPVGKHIVRVCHGTACHVSGARQINDEVRRHLAIPEGEDTDAARMFTVEEVACLGCCSLAPVLMVDSQTAGRLTPSTAADALAPFEDRETV
jgi:NADH:ubiquinone oxidoreductase subunit E